MVMKLNRSIRSPEDLGEVLREHRVKNLKKQDEVGSPFGIKQGTISNIENGAHGTRVDTLFKLLAAMGLQMTICDRQKTIITASGNLKSGDSTLSGHASIEPKEW